MIIVIDDCIIANCALYGNLSFPLSLSVAHHSSPSICSVPFVSLCSAHACSFSLTSGYCKHSHSLISKYFPAASSQRLCSAHSCCCMKSHGAVPFFFVPLPLFLLLLKSTCGRGRSRSVRVLYHSENRL